MIGKSDDGSDIESQHSVLREEDEISIEDALDRRSAGVERLTLGALTAAADVSVRTVRYYIAEGLLPPPEGSGPGSAYTQGHLDRLRLIQRLKEAYLPLKEIRRRLSSGCRCGRKGQSRSRGADLRRSLNPRISRVNRSLPSRQAWRSGTVTVSPSSASVTLIWQVSRELGRTS